MSDFDREIPPTKEWKGTSIQRIRLNEPLDVPMQETEPATTVDRLNNLTHKIRTLTERLELYHEAEDRKIKELEARIAALKEIKK
jgi:uncharacterized protein YlxW (UPF0749 family)